MQVDKDGNWRLWWGNMPLPDGAKVKGTVDHRGRRGALILLASGRYVMGNHGMISNLPGGQHDGY